MNTVDDPEGADDISLKLRGDQKKLNQHETMIESRPVKGDDDSEEAILFERSVHVAYENVPSTHSLQSK